MRLKDTLFAQPDVSIYQVDPDTDHSINDFLHWRLTPIHSETLAAEFVHDRILDGVFILKAAFVTQSGEIRDGYVDVVMPERISETAYLLEDGHIRQKSYRELKYWGVPLVAIEGFGAYELFYSRSNPEIGLEVLRKGLAVARDRENIAANMGYILRDEKRYQEAVEAFTVAIEEGEAMGHGKEQYFQYYYAEREELLKKLDATKTRAPIARE